MAERNFRSANFKGPAILPSDKRQPHQMEPLHTAAARGDLSTLYLLLTTKLRDADPSAVYPPLRRQPSFLHRLFHPSTKSNIVVPSVTTLEDDSRSLAASFSELAVSSTAIGAVSTMSALPSEVKEYVNASNRFGMSALHAACFHGQLDAVQLLLQFGADPNQQSRAALQSVNEAGSLPDGAAGESSASVNWTFALHVAAFRGRHGIVRELLECGADPYLLDFRGLTAAEVAEGAKHSRTARIIRKYVAERSKEADDAEAVAVRYSRDSVVAADSTDRSPADEQTARLGKSDSSLLAAPPRTSLSSQDRRVSTKPSSSQADLRPVVPERCPIALPSGPWDRDDIYLDASSRGRDKLQRPSTEDFSFD